MIISIIITVVLLYVAFNTKFNGSNLPYWALICIVAISLASWQSAIVMLIIAGWTIYKGVKYGDVDTLDWLEDLIND